MAGTNCTITASLLRNLFFYSNGKLYWKHKTNTKTILGSEAGCINPSTGYVYIGIHKKRYAAHRLIFLFHNNFLPKFIDHIDGNILNNCIENLREATKQQNNANSKIRCDNTSGYKGVSWCKRKQRWRAYIQTNKSNMSLGSFATAEEAAFAVSNARLFFHKQFARHS